MSEAPVTENPAKILIVEDSEHHIILAKATLEQFGVVPMVAQTADEALECYRNNSLDIILMDLQMPAKSGYEITYEIRRLEHEGQRKHVPIIAVTAFLLGDAADKCRKAGMDGCVSKPVTVDLCRQIFQEYLPHVTLA